jgi:hypothetical protein
MRQIDRDRVTSTDGTLAAWPRSTPRPLLTSDNARLPGVRLPGVAGVLPPGRLLISERVEHHAAPRHGGIDGQSGMSRPKADSFSGWPVTCAVAAVPEFAQPNNDGHEAAEDSSNGIGAVRPGPSRRVTSKVGCK